MRYAYSLAACVSGVAGRNSCDGLPCLLSVRQTREWVAAWNMIEDVRITKTSLLHGRRIGPSIIIYLPMGNPGPA
jgi:hypothetical protein